MLFGKTIDVPRLTAWYGDAGTGYAYSGIRNVPLPWTPALIEVKQAVEPPSGVVFNSVLLIRYGERRQPRSPGASKPANGSLFLPLTDFVGQRAQNARKRGQNCLFW